MVYTPTVWISGNPPGVDADKLNNIEQGIVDYGCPQGMIAMWSGLIINIPAGWALCDGGDGTPDLRDMFIQSVGAAEDPGDTGGATTLALDSVGAEVNDVSAGAQAAYRTTGNNDMNHDGGADDGYALASQIADGRPPFYKLAFIMKL